MQPTRTAARSAAGRALSLSIIALLGVSLAALAACGDVYRPVVTPINPVGPASQPSTFVMVTTTTGSSSSGLANVFDGSGDTLLTQASLGNGPLAATLGLGGTPAITSNFDGTINSYTPSTTLETYEVQTSTLLPPGLPFNMATTADYLFVTLKNEAAAAVLRPVSSVPTTGSTGSSGSGSPGSKGSGSGGSGGTTTSSPGIPYQFLQLLPLAASPVNFAGNANAQRIYAISQDNGTNSVAFGDCEKPFSITTPGQLAAIETATLTISNIIPVGICPVYGVMSTDDLRTFILNRGSGTVTSINSQFNQLDSTPNLPNLNPTTGAITLPPPANYSGPPFKAGPVFADFYAPSSQLVTANYDSNTISIINVSLDAYGNDSSQFGETVTVPVGRGPAALTILRDGSRVYVANQLDSTVSVVNLSTFQVEATIPVTGHPISIASLYSTPYGQVYVIPSDQPYMTVIRTDTDQVDAAVQLDGTGIDVRASTQYAGAATANTAANPLNESHASGSGAPCGFGAPCVLPP